MQTNERASESARPTNSHLLFQSLFFPIKRFKELYFSYFFLLLLFFELLFVATIWRLIGVRVYSQRELDILSIQKAHEPETEREKKPTNRRRNRTANAMCFSLSLSLLRFFRFHFLLILLDTIIICAFLFPFSTEHCVCVCLVLSPSLSLRFSLQLMTLRLLHSHRFTDYCCYFQRRHVRFQKNMLEIFKFHQETKQIDKGKRTEIEIITELDDLMCNLR